MTNDSEDEKANANKEAANGIENGGGSSSGGGGGTTTGTTVAEVEQQQNQEGNKEKVQGFQKMQSGFWKGDVQKVAFPDFKET